MVLCALVSLARGGVSLSWPRGGQNDALCSLRLPARAAPLHPHFGSNCDFSVTAGAASMRALGSWSPSDGAGR